MTAENAQLTWGVVAEMCPDSEAVKRIADDPSGVGRGNGIDLLPGEAEEGAIGAVAAVYIAHLLGTIKPGWAMIYRQFAEFLTDKTSEPLLIEQDFDDRVDPSRSGIVSAIRPRFSPMGALDLDLYFNDALVTAPGLDRWFPNRATSPRPIGSPNVFVAGAEDVVDYVSSEYIQPEQWGTHPLTYTRDLGALSVLMQMSMTGSPQIGELITEQHPEIVAATNVVVETSRTLFESGSPSDFDRVLGYVPELHHLEPHLAEEILDQATQRAYIRGRAGDFGNIVCGTHDLVDIFTRTHVPLRRIEDNPEAELLGGMSAYFEYYRKVRA